MFVNPADYDKVQENDRLSILGLKEFAPGKNLSSKSNTRMVKFETVTLRHTFNAEQIKWFKAGSA